MRNKTELCETPTKDTDEEGQRDRRKTEAEVTQEEGMVLQKKDGQHFAVSFSLRVLSSSYSRKEERHTS